MLPQAGAPVEVYEEVARWFDEEEIVALTLTVVGHYVSPHRGE